MECKYASEQWNTFTKSEFMYEFMCSAIDEG